MRNETDNLREPRTEKIATRLQRYCRTVNFTPCDKLNAIVEDTENEKFTLSDSVARVGRTPTERRIDSIAGISSTSESMRRALNSIRGGRRKRYYLTPRCARAISPFDNVDRSACRGNPRGDTHVRARTAQPRRPCSQARVHFSSAFSPADDRFSAVPREIHRGFGSR